MALDAIRLLTLHPVFETGFAVLAVLPLLLLASFLTFGRRRRRRNLTTLGVADRPALDLVTAANVESPEETFGEYLRRTYDELHNAKHYVLPNVVFHVPYWVGLYWTAVTLAYLAEPTAEAWAANTAIWTAATTPALGFLGGAIAAIFHMGARIIRNDVSPRMYHHMALRILVAPVFAVVIVKMSDVATSDNIARIVALLSGFLPSEAFRFVIDQGMSILSRSKAPRSELSLTAIQGIGHEEELRLWEEGIQDAEQLAIESTVSLLVFTNYSLERILDWKDQAFLYCYAPKDLEALRDLYVRGAMDILGLDEHYYDPVKSAEMRDALAGALGKPRPAIDRFVDTIYNDPRVHQLWEYLKHSHPTIVAQPIIDKFDRLQQKHEAAKGGGE